MHYTQLTENERYQIYTLLSVGLDKTAIASQLGRSPSTIGREIARNKGLRGYRPTQAQRLNLNSSYNSIAVIITSSETTHFVF